jgi:uncharacterized protein (DUF2147 family)
MHRQSLLALALLAAPLTAAAQTPAPPSPILGQWLTESHRGVVEIFSCADKLCGKLVWLIQPIRRGGPALDDDNPKPELRQRPLCGLVMLGDFVQTDAQHWEDGWIYDPDSGKTYHANMTLTGTNGLDVRGYVGIPLLGETQHWIRSDGSLGSCTQASRAAGDHAGPGLAQ